MGRPGQTLGRKANKETPQQWKEFGTIEDSAVKKKFLEYILHKHLSGAAGSGAKTPCRGVSRGKYPAEGLDSSVRITFSVPCRTFWVSKNHCRDIPRSVRGKRPETTAPQEL